LGDPVGISFGFPTLNMAGRHGINWLIESISQSFSNKLIFFQSFPILFERN
jgi:hypothetical protein